MIFTPRVFGEVQGFPMRSLRFDGGVGSVLTKTFAANPTVRTKCTMSFWVKLAAVAEQVLYCGYDGSSSYGNYLFFNSTNALNFALGGAESWLLTTTRLFRDTNAWMHVVVAVDTTDVTDSNRMKMYINGVQETSFSAATYPPQNAFHSMLMTSGNDYIGRFYSGTGYLYGYLADVVIVDGQALGPSQFARANPSTGTWEPKLNPTTGVSLGTNGFWLSFDDATSPATLVHDDGVGIRGGGAGSNDWTDNNIIVASDYTTTSYFDVPIDYDDGLQKRGNYCTFDIAAKTSSNHYHDYGDLRAYYNVATWALSVSSFGITSGKWYWEAQHYATYAYIGIYNDQYLEDSASYLGAVGTHSYGYASDTGALTYNGTSVAYGDAFYPGDTIGVIFDADNGKLYFSKNNTVQASGDPVAGTGYAISGITGVYFPAVSTNNNTVTINFGQRPFENTTLWSTLKANGFKTLCTTNLPIPATPRPDRYFTVNTRAGTAGAGSVAGKLFSPNLIVSKSLSARSWGWANSVRGTGKSLSSDTTALETSNAQGVTAFNAGGFSFGTLQDLFNKNGENFVDYMWSTGALQGVDIGTFTAPVSGNHLVPHALGVTPAMYIIKCIQTTTGNWPVWHKGSASATADYLFLNTDAAVANSAGYWGAGPSSTNLGLSVGKSTVASKQHLYIAFADVPGFSRFGAYTSNNSSDGPLIWCGFRPKFALIKHRDAQDYWTLIDSIRSPNAGYRLYPNNNFAEATDAGSELEFRSTGLKIRGSGAYINYTPSVYIYAAFADIPMKYARAV